MAYNLTELGSQETMVGVFQSANNATSGVLAGFFIIALFFLLMLMMKKYEFTKALMSASFITFILASLLTYAKLVSIVFPLLFLAIAAFTAFFVYMTGDKQGA